MSQSLAFIVKPPFLKALLASVILWSHCCQSQPAGRVTLAIGRTNTHAIVSWPYPSRGFELQFATNLRTTNWQPATATSISNAGRWEVTAPAGQPSSFFRLKNHLQYFGFGQGQWPQVARSPSSEALSISPWAAARELPETRPSPRV